MVTEPPGTNLTDDHRDPGCLGALIAVVAVSALPADPAGRPRRTGQSRCGWRHANLRADWIVVAANMDPSRVAATPIKVAIMSTLLVIVCALALAVIAGMAVDPRAARPTRQRLDTKPEANPPTP
jgi:hypothetical protein